MESPEILLCIYQCCAVLNIFTDFTLTSAGTITYLNCITRNKVREGYTGIDSSVENLVWINPPQLLGWFQSNFAYKCIYHMNLCIGEWISDWKLCPLNGLSHLHVLAWRSWDVEVLKNWIKCGQNLRFMSSVGDHNACMRSSILSLARSRVVHPILVTFSRSSSQSQNLD